MHRTSGSFAVQVRRVSDEGVANQQETVVLLNRGTNPFARLSPPVERLVAEVAAVRDAALPPAPPHRIAPLPLTVPAIGRGGVLREAAAVGRVALRADWRAGLAALWDVVRGRRVRGLNKLHALARTNPDWYGRWVRAGEPAMLDAWTAARSAGGADAPRVACLLIGAERPGSAETIATVRKALPDGHVIPQPVRDPAMLRVVLGRARAAGCTHLIALRAGDTVSPALGQVLAAVLANPAVAAAPVLYWDCDSLIDGVRTDPLIKPDWDEHLLRECDLLGSAALMRVDAVARLLGSATIAPDLRADGEGIVHLQAALCREGVGDPPVHLPLILTHRAGGQALVPEAARRAALAAAGLGPVPDPVWPWPSVSVIVPTRDQAGLLRSCLDGLARLDYPGDVEVLILDNDSAESATRDLFDELAADRRARIVPCPGPFNFAALINRGVRLAQGRFVCLLNNDVEPLDSLWLRHLVREALDPAVGAVGARLLYPDGTIQHAGIALGIGGAAGHVQKGVDPADPLLANWHGATRRVAAVTGACLLVDRAKFIAVEGMDEQAFAVDFNDVDLCLRLQQAGWINLVVPAATLIHHESKSRGLVRDPAGQARFVQETAALQARWDTAGCRDPWFSPLFRWQSEPCQLRF